MPEFAANFAETTILGGRTQEWRTTALEFA
jgi:hypothetical protein